MNTLLIQIIAIVSLLVGIYLGYKISDLLYEIWMLKSRKNTVRKAHIDEFCVVNEIVNERYNLGALNLYPDYSSFENDFSIQQLNKIGKFLNQMEELGVHFIYLKPREKNNLIYVATGINKNGTFIGKITVDEYLN